MATTTGLTVQDFLAQPLPEGQRYELVDGRIVPMGNTKYPQERVKANANVVFVGYFLQHSIGLVHLETMYQLADDEARQPDLSILLNDQIPARAPDSLLDLAPAVVFDVVSSESASYLERRVERFLEKGSLAVLIAYPESRVIHIFTPDGLFRAVRADQFVTLDCLPGFSVPTSRFFEGL